MSGPAGQDTPIIESILHPSDFSEGSEVAFAHALKVALIARSQLTLIHVSPDMTADWGDFPGVRETLERWGLLPPDSPRWAVPKLGIDVRKVIAHDRAPAASVHGYLEEHPVDLIVLAAHQRDEGALWSRGSVAESVARKGGQATLYVPYGGEGFVSRRDGSVSLERILIPVALKPRAQPALAAAARLVTRLERPAGTFTLLHVGAPRNMPAVDRPSVPGWRWDAVTEEGEVIDTIVDTAESTKADLIVMTTDGRNGFLDALRGSHSERILRRTPCPLLVIPELSAIDDALSED